MNMLAEADGTKWTFDVFSCSNKTWFTLRCTCFHTNYTLAAEPQTTKLKDYVFGSASFSAFVYLARKTSIDHHISPLLFMRKSIVSHNPGQAAFCRFLFAQWARTFLVKLYFNLCRTGIIQFIGLKFIETVHRTMLFQCSDPTFLELDESNIVNLENVVHSLSNICVICGITGNKWILKKPWNVIGSFSDLTQEVASKGLGLVYEHGGGENKDELVSLLVDTLMTGSR